jgi:hypothetical protein
MFQIMWKHANVGMNENVNVLTHQRATLSGGRGIRTPGDLAATTDFKSVALNHSAIPPGGEDFTIT